MAPNHKQVLPVFPQVSTGECEGNGKAELRGNGKAELRGLDTGYEEQSSNRNPTTVNDKSSIREETFHLHKTLTCVIKIKL